MWQVLRILVPLLLQSLIKNAAQKFPAVLVCVFQCSCLSKRHRRVSFRALSGFRNNETKECKTKTRPFIFAGKA